MQVSFLPAWFFVKLQITLKFRESWRKAKSKIVKQMDFCPQRFGTAKGSLCRLLFGRRNYSKGRIEDVNVQNYDWCFAWAEVDGNFRGDLVGHCWSRTWQGLSCIASTESGDTGNRLIVWHRHPPSFLSKLVERGYVRVAELRKMIRDDNGNESQRSNEGFNAINFSVWRNYLLGRGKPYLDSYLFRIR